MSDREKIFHKDPNLPLKSTTKRPMDSRRDINLELDKWGIKKVAWNWDLNNGVCQINFELPRDKFQEKDLPLWVRLKPPIVWMKKGRYKTPEIDWRLSIRLLYWFIHYQLAWVYANQSSNVVAFLPHIAVDKDRTVSQVVIPQIRNLNALPRPQEEEKLIEIE